MKDSRGSRARFIRAALAVLLVMVLAPAASHASIPDLDSFEYPAQTFAAPDEAAGTTGTRPAPGPGIEPQIVGGNETTVEKYPWQVQITRFGSAHCGGTLIHPRVVITAAHCLREAPGFDGFYPGLEAFTGRTFSESGGEQLAINNLYTPQSYTPGGSFANDYAYFSLSAPSTRPLMKIAGSNENAVWKPGRVGVSTGYGNTAQDGSGSPVLKEVAMPFIDDSFCGGASAYSTTFLQPVMVCAGSLAGGQSTCQGDSGGSLLARIDGGYRLVGVTSFAEGCAKPNKPTVFTRIAGPTLAAIIAANIREIEQSEGFPPAEQGVQVFGSGAKPLGCAAAFAAAGVANQGVTNAGKKSSGAARALKAAKKQAKKARKKSRATRKKAARRLKAAKRKAGAAARALTRARADASAAGSAAQSACN